MKKDSQIETQGLISQHIRCSHWCFVNLVSPRCQKKVSKGIRPSPLLNGDVQIHGDFIHCIPSIQKEFEGDS